MSRAASAEARFVLALARGNGQGVREAMEANPHWPRVVDLAGSHQVDALCWRNWRQAREGDFPAIPAAVLDPLKEAWQRVHLSNRILIDELSAVYGALRRAGLDAIVLKGPWLAFRAYPDPGTRPVGDIDLCIRDLDYEAAAAALRGIGYQAGPDTPPGSREALRTAHFTGQLRFQARHRRLVELHFRLVNFGPPADEPWLWRDARTMPIAGEAIQVPGASAMLLHLILHAGQHGFASLRLLHDIRWELSADSAALEVEMLLDRIRALRCRALAYQALLLSAQIAGACVPDELLRALRPSALRRRVFSRLWRLERARRLEAARAAQRLELPRLYLLECGSPWQKGRYLMELASQGGGLHRHLARAVSRFRPTRAVRLLRPNGRQTSARLPRSRGEAPPPLAGGPVPPPLA